MSRDLYRHQARALEKLPDTGGYLAFEQGLGKTLTAIRWVERHREPRVLVVCPAVAVGVWEQELEGEGHDVFLPFGSRKEKAAQIEAGRYPWVVLNYEALLEKAVEKAIEKWDPDIVIIDEAQKIKTATAKRSRALHRITSNRAALLLSGTPITKNLLDLYSQYKAIDPLIFDGVSWTKFKQRYAIMGGYGGYEVIGYRDTEDLKARIAPYTVVARKEDTLDLPPKTHQNIPVGLGGEWESYRQMALTGVALDWVTTTPLEKALRLSQIAGAAKVASTVDFARDLAYSQDEPVVVYFRFRAEGDALADALEVPQLNGDTPMGVRAELVDAFQSGEMPIFLSQVTAGSTAITLTRASHMIYHSLSFSYEDWAQSQDRIHRIGQTSPVFYYYMVATGPQGGKTIDHLVLRALDTKEDLAGMITQDPTLLLPKEGS